MIAEAADFAARLGDPQAARASSPGREARRVTSVPMRAFGGGGTFPATPI